MDTSVLLTAFGALVAILFMRWLVYIRKLPPGPWNLPIVGYLPFLSRSTHLDFQKLSKKYGNIFSVRLGSHYVVVLNDYESTKDAFAQDTFIGSPPDGPFDFNQESIETEARTGLPWKEQRRFSLHMLRDLGLGKSKLEAQLQEEISELLELYEKSVGEPIYVKDLLIPSMSNNIATLVFGKRLPYNHPDRQMLTDVINKGGEAAGQIMWQFLFPWLRNICKILGIGDVDRLQRISRILKNYIMKEINEHEATLNPNNIRDFIDGYLLEIQKRNDPAFCKEVLEDLVSALFGAGSETVRLTLEWLLLTAAGHPEAQKRIQKEIDEVVGRSRPPIGSDAKLMPYTEAFKLEIWRWRTLLPLNIMHYTLFDTELGGYFIPKHTNVLANLWAIHHDPKYWGADAEEFRVERFLTEDGKEVKKWDRMIPFSTGKRSCPGEPLAKVETFLYFTSILQKFNVRMADDAKPDYAGTLGLGYAPKPQKLILTKRI